MNDSVAQEIQSALAEVTKRETLTTIYFVACGGSFAQMHLPKYVIDRESKTLAAEAFNSAEFILRNQPKLGPSSLVVLASTSGNTPETVAAAKFAREAGAYTIGLTAKPESDLGQASDSVVTYVPQSSDGDIDSVGANLLQIVFGLLRDHEGNAKYDAVVKSLPALPSIVARAHEERVDDVLRWASASKREKIIYTMGSGVNYGVAYSYAICILMEMQWINSQAIHAGEYFHGPFEITDENVPVIMVMGLGDARKMDDRALAFLRKYTDKILVIDMEAMDLAGLDASVVEYFQPLIVMPVLRNYAIRLAAERGHPLTERRYMWQMEY